jgi:hypothetical protein
MLQSLLAFSEQPEPLETSSADTVEEGTIADIPSIKHSHL